MHNKEFKERLRTNKVVIGSWIQIDHPVIAEIMAASGFDFLVIDLEHSVIELSSLQVLLQAMGKSGPVPLVRLSSNDPVQIKKIMDSGAKGIIVPDVRSKEDAERAVKAIKYPQQGERGVGLFRAQGYGADFKEYFNTINSDSVVIVQIEHREAVGNIKSIVEVNAIDGVMIGPYDISTSYGVPGEFEHPRVKEAQAIVKKAAQNKAKALGVHMVWPPAEKIVEKIEEGFNFIVYSSDMIMLQYHFKDATEKIRNVLKKSSIAKARG